MSQCGDEDIQRIAAAIGSDDPGALDALDRLIEAHADDARLHFLRGSLLASAGRLIEAHHALARAVEADPAFAIARFQLGFFELTSGEVARALATLRPLLDLPDEHHLRLFAEGLGSLVADRFGEAVRLLERGIAANGENAPLNRDMMLLAERCRELAGEAPPADATEASATSFLLGQIDGRTMH